jgi:hypothetical protein
VSVYLVAVLPLLLVLFLLAVQNAIWRHRQLELQIAADAAALAGANALVDDLLLTELPAAQNEVMTRAEEAARHYASLNRVWGTPLRLQSNPANASNGEMLLGTLDHASSRLFNNQLPLAMHLYDPGVDAFRVEARRQGVAAHSTAYVERDVVGFKIQGSLSVPGQTVPAIPLVPVALFCDPCPPGISQAAQAPLWATRDKKSWEYQVMARLGADVWNLLQKAGLSDEVSTGDGIPEMRISLSEQGAHQTDNAHLLAIGVGSVSEAIRQIQTGVTVEDLQDRQHRLLLEDQNVTILPRVPVASTDMQKLAAALAQIVGQKRVWPLYSGLQVTDKGEWAVVPGFVAARLLSVQWQSDSRTAGDNPVQLIVTLQPTMLITATAVTDYRRRDTGVRCLFNPYICKVRLVE